MTNAALQLKIKLRLNKLDSQDFDNIAPWQMLEAFNKGMTDWCRRNLHGLNIVKEGDEQSTSRIDDLQRLMTSVSPILTNRQTFFETVNQIPADYLRFKRISAQASSECCPKPRPMVVYLAEEANPDILLRDKNKKPSFEWAETFATFTGNKIRIYTNGEFLIDSLELTYYRQPRKVEFAGVMDPYTGVTPTVDVEGDFNEDLMELFVDEAVKILGGDIESGQGQRASQSVESNN